MLVNLLVNLAAVCLDVVVEPRHHGVPGTDLGNEIFLTKKIYVHIGTSHLGSCQVSGRASVLELEELHPFLVFLQAKIVIISPLTDFLLIVNSSQ